MKAANVITVYNPDGTTSTFTLNSVYELVVFDVIVTNPCESTTIEDLVFTTEPLVAVDGSTGYTEWPAPVTQVDIDSGNVFQACGALAYEVYSDTSSTALSSSYAGNWAVVNEPSDGTYRLTADTNIDLDLIGNQGY